MEAAQRAARLEREFIEAFERNLRSFPRFLDPRDGRAYSSKRAKYQRQNRIKALSRALKKRGYHLREHLYSYPVGSVVSVSFKRPLSSSSFFLVAASLTRFEPYLEQSPEAVKPLGATQITEFLQKNKLPPQAFAIYGFFSATGWEEGTLQRLEQSPRICLVAPESDGSWKLKDNLDWQTREYRWLFDPEGKEGRISKLAEKIASFPQLSVPGGFLPLEKLCVSLDIDQELLDLSLEKLSQRRPEFFVEEIEGIRILKRRRS